MTELNNKTRVIAAFPGCGKSHFTNNSELLVSDSDSSTFDKKHFPGNYIEHIKQRIADGYDVVFVSSHETVRKALVDAGIEFTLVYPHVSLKDEYIERYENRGSSQNFIDLLSDNWELWIYQCMNQTGCTKVELKPGQYIGDSAIFGGLKYWDK